MFRNSADHGIEAPEERRRLGKRAAGSIRISARQSGGHIYLELSDDGRGIDPARLRARAVAMGLMNAAEADHMSDAAAQALIFEPGLSTATAITAISGRGVGMDVVRSNLERIGGSVEVRSRLGQGTTFRSEEHTSELQSLMRISYAVFCLKKKTTPNTSEY